jgi:hypothetical protein
MLTGASTSCLAGSANTRGTDNPMSDNYRLMVYFAVATLHLYRKSIEPYQFGETVEDFMRRNVDVRERVMIEARNLFDYELSHEQLSRAFASYLAPGQSVKDFGPATRVPGKDIAEHGQ